MVPVALLHASMQEYQYRALQVELEGNNLYSSTAILVNENPRDALELLPELGDDARILVIPEGVPEVRYMAANHIESVPVPYHDGTGFTGKEGEALVGASISSINLGDTVRVGTLGLGDSSLLAHQVVISDRGAIAQIGGTVVVDGEHAVEAYSRLRPNEPVEAVGRGMSRHTDIDVLSPVLQLAATALMPLGALGSGLMLAHAHAPHVRVAEIIGFTRGQALMVLTVAFMLVTAGLILCCLSLLGSLLGHGIMGYFDVRLIAPLLALNAFAITRGVT